MRPVCEVHDWMYGEGETLVDKMIADVVFLMNLVLRIISEKNMLDKARLYRAMTYFIAVFYCGEEAFGKGRSPKAAEVDLKEYEVNPIATSGNPTTEEE